MKQYFFQFLSILIKLLKYGLIIIIGLFFISLILLTNVYKNFNNTYKFGLIGKEQLNAATAQLQNKDWDKAAAQAEIANHNFNLALQELEQSKKNLLIKKFYFFRNQVNDLEYLFKTTEILSRSLIRVIDLAKEFETMSSGSKSNSFNDLKEDDKIKLLRLVYESGPELNGLKANLNIALLNINKIHKIGILWPIYKDITDYKYQLIEVIGLIDNLEPLSKLLLVLGGYPNESNLLILLQNNDELRPTGGFIGSFGLATIKNGQIISLETKDSYHLDMPAVGKWQKEPPAPIKKYLGVENWYLRDANWTPDWPIAAQKILEIYSGESKAIGTPVPNFSAIIGINPDFISDLLKIVGPITINNENYYPENFQELLQYNVEVAYKERDISSWDRKNIMNDLLTELKNRLFNLSPKDWPKLINAVNKNIQEKNIQIHFTDSSLRSLSDNLNASGEIKQTDKDFLMVVDANLAAFKSDSVVKKAIAYNLYQKNNEVNSSLTLKYRHEGGFDWRTTRYRSYTRVYLPLGSRFLSFSGLKNETADWSTSDDEILNKTIFSFFLTVEPGTNKEIILNYSLPDRINQQINENNYELFIQKQAGRRTEELVINFYPDSAQSVSWTSDFKTDKIFNPLNFKVKP